MKSSSGTISSKAIHSIVGVAIMFLFRYLPISLPEVTPVGMEIIGIFIGTHESGACPRFWKSSSDSDVLFDDCYECHGLQ